MVASASARIITGRLNPASSFAALQHFLELHEDEAQ
jgi:hypothetical protein